MSDPIDPGLPDSARWLAPGTFAGQVAVVTGGGTGLGLEISRGLAALGAEVAILSRSAEHHTAFLDECAARGWKGYALAVDVRENGQVRDAAKEVLAKSGRCDVLVNNAAGNFVCPTERLTANAWRAVLGIALDGTFYCSREFGRAMIAAGSGQQLNVCATYAHTGMPYVAHSASAKGGVLTLTYTLAAEWARYGVRVNAISPGPFTSEGAAQNLWPEDEVEERLKSFLPLGRFATAAEVAAQCLHILSPASAWMTGECMTFDGGASLPRSYWEPGERTRGRAGTLKKDG